MTAKTINNIDIENICSFSLKFNFFFDKANDENIKLSKILYEIEMRF